MIRTKNPIVVFSLVATMRYANCLAISLIIFRPFCIKRFKGDNNSQTGVESTYHGKIAKVVEPVTKNSGCITLYDERWSARLADGEEEIPVGNEVKIVGNDSLIMFVEKIN